jgi:PAS domain-containing protein
MDELAQTIELRRSQGLDAALALVRSDRGKRRWIEFGQSALKSKRPATIYWLQQREQVRTSAYQAGFISTAGERSRFRAPGACHDHHPEGNAPPSTADRRSSAERGAAKEARDLLQTTISSIGDGVITTDTAGKVVFLNPVAQSLTGWTQEQAAGKPLEEIFDISDEETGAAVENPVGKVLREGTIASLTGAHQAHREGRPSHSD